MAAAAGSEFILRDYLAAARTTLANERTLLAYFRTALSLLITGAVLIRFVESAGASLGGGLAILMGLATLGIGLERFRRMSVYIRREVKRKLPVNAQSGDA